MNQNHKTSVVQRKGFLLNSLEERNIWWGSCLRKIACFSLLQQKGLQFPAVHKQAGYTGWPGWIWSSVCFSWRSNNCEELRSEEIFTCWRENTSVSAGEWCRSQEVWHQTSFSLVISVPLCPDYWTTELLFNLNNRFTNVRGGRAQSLERSQCWMSQTSVHTNLHILCVYSRQCDVNVWLENFSSLQLMSVKYLQKYKQIAEGCFVQLWLDLCLPSLSC